MDGQINFSKGPFSHDFTDLVELSSCHRLASGFLEGETDHSRELEVFPGPWREVFVAYSGRFECLNSLIHVCFFLLLTLFESKHFPIILIC